MDDHVGTELEMSRVYIGGVISGEKTLEFSNFDKCGFGFIGEKTNEISKKIGLSTVSLSLSLSLSPFLSHSLSLSLSNTQRGNGIGGKGS